MSADHKTIDLRQEIAESANKIGIAKTARLYGVHERTVKKWQQRFNDQGSCGLTNSSRKSQKHPGRMASEIETAIIETAKANPTWSARQIKDRLNLSCTLATILKKIKSNAVTSTDSTANATASPLSVFYIVIQKTGFPVKQLPKYEIIIKDLYNGFCYTGFSQENSALSAAIFTDYFLSCLTSYGYSNQQKQFIVPKSRLTSTASRKKSLFEELLIKKYSAVISRAEDHSYDYSVSSFNTSCKNIQNEFDLFYHSLHLFSSASLQISDIDILKNPKILIAPILTDNHLKALDRIRNQNDYWSQVEKKNEKTIANVLIKLLKNGSEFSQPQEQQKAFSDYKDLLILLNNPQSRQLYYSKALVRMGEIFYHSGHWEKSAALLTESLALTVQSGDLTDYFRALGWLGTIKLKNGYYLEAETILAQGVKIANSRCDYAAAAALTGKIGNVKQRQGELTKALNCYKKELSLAEKCSQNREIYDALINLAGYYSFKTECNQVLALLTRALECAKKCDDEIMLAECNSRLGEHHYQNFNLDLAIHHLDIASQLALKNRHQELQLHCFSLAGLVKLRQADYPAAEKDLEKSLLLSEKLSNLTATLQSLRYLGQVGWYQEDLKKALKYFKRYYKLALELKDPEHLAIASGNIGIVYGKLKQFAEALKFHKKQRTLAAKIGNTNMFCTALNNIGVLYLDMKDYAKAINCFSDLLKQNENRVDKLNISLTHHNIALAKSRLFKYASADKSFSKAATVAQEINSSYHLAEIYANWAVLHLDNRKKELAEQYLKQAFDYARQSGRLKIVADVESLLKTMT